MTNRIAYLILACGLLVATANAQDTGDDPTATADSSTSADADTGTTGSSEQVGPVGPADDAIDEITVQGQRTPYQLEKVMIKARLDFWDVYNSINNIEDYRVICRREGRAGTNFKSTRCVPKYFSDRMSDLTQESIINGAPAPSINRVAQLTRNKKADADRYMIELIETSPSLREKYEALLEATANYQESQRKDD